MTVEKMNELILKNYNLLPKKDKMTVKERCELQRLLKSVLTQSDLPDADYENFKYHADHFEDDILIIVSNVEFKISQELATIGLASTRIAESLSKI